MSGSFLPTRVLAVCLLYCLPAVPALAWNQPPVANIHDAVTPYIQGASIGASVALDGSDSYDPDGDDIITYRWKIYHWTGYGYSYDRTVTGEVTSTSFSEGRYQISLDVQDEHQTWSQSPDNCYVYVVTVSISSSDDYVSLNGLVSLSASVTPTNIGGEARLSKTRSGNGNVNVWRPVGGNPKGELLSLPWSWPLSHGSIPAPLYVEATATSSAINDVTLTLSFVASGQAMNPHSVTFTVINPQITAPTGIGRDVSFNSSSPGVCSFTVSGTTGVPPLDQYIEWTVAAIPESTLTSSPSPARGPSVIFTYTGLPSSNSAFGYKGFSLFTRKPSGEVVAQTQSTLGVFFSPEARNHPVLSGEETLYGNTPNWFYYWRKGNVVYPLNTENDGAGVGFDDVDGYGVYKTAEGHVYVRRLAGGTDTEDITFTNLFYETRVRTGPSGLWDASTSGDDVPEIPYPFGKPDSVAIIPGVGRTTLDTTLTQYTGDDEHGTVVIDSVTLPCITTGNNGYLQTTRKGQDRLMVYYHPVTGEPSTIQEPPYDGGMGGGEPWTVAVTAGQNHFLESAINLDGGTGENWLDFSDGITKRYQGTWSGIDLCVITIAHEATHRVQDIWCKDPNAVDTDGYNWNSVTMRCDALPPSRVGDWVPDVDSVNDRSNGPYCLFRQQEDTWNFAETFERPEYEDYADNEFRCRMTEMEITNAGLENWRNASADWSKDGKQWHVGY